MKPKPLFMRPPIMEHNHRTVYVTVGGRPNAPLSRDEINFLQLYVEAQAAAQARPQGIRSRVRGMLGMKPTAAPLPPELPQTHKR